MSLKILKLKKSYLQGGRQLDILSGVEAEVQDGEVVAVVGQSGSGKSTLLSMLAGLDRPDSGEIVLGQNHFSKMNEEQMTHFRGRNIGIVFQQFHLMSHLTALENVMLPLEIMSEEKIRDRAMEILGQMGLQDRMGHFPSQLSGGECQRVAIARALVLRPQLLLADEPSGNLDIKTGEAVMNIFFEIVRKYKMTTLLVTHSHELAKRCDRELILKNGVL